MNREILGNRVKKLRLDRGYKIKQVADEIGMSAANLGEAERGLVELKADNRVKLADFFGIPVDYLLREDYELGTETLIFDEFTEYAKKLPPHKQKMINEIEKAILKYFK